MEAFLFEAAEIVGFDSSAVPGTEASDPMDQDLSVFLDDSDVATALDWDGFRLELHGITTHCACSFMKARPSIRP